MPSMDLKPLPIPLPIDYAELLRCHPSKISHVNAGRRRLNDDQIEIVLRMIPKDKRLKGLTIFHLRPKNVDRFKGDFAPKKGRPRRG